MIRLRLKHAADGLKLIAAFLVAASGVRLLTVGLTRAAAGIPPTSAGASKATAKPPAQPPRPTAGGGPERTLDAEPASQPGGDRQAPPARSVVRVELGVAAGPPGSEVYVKGRRKGTSPFVGDVVCTAGETITIEVLPPTGMPLAFTRVCEPGSPIHVNGD